MHGKFRRNVVTLNQTFTLGFLHILLSLVIVSTVCCFRNDYVQEDVMRIIMLWLMGAHLFLFNVVMPVFLIVNLKMTMPEFFENAPASNVLAPATAPKQFYVIRLELAMNLKQSFLNHVVIVQTSPKVRLQLYIRPAVKPRREEGLVCSYQQFPYPEGRWGSQADMKAMFDTQPLIPPLSLLKVSSKDHC